MSFNDVIIGYNIEDDGLCSGKLKIKIIASADNENSLRIYNIVLALSEASYDEFYKFRVVKLGQYRKDNYGLKEI